MNTRRVGAPTTFPDLPLPGSPGAHDIAVSPWYRLFVTLHNIRVVLHRPRGASNVGAVARAVGNMGLGDLVIVRHTPLRDAAVRAMAVHAGVVVDRMRWFPTLAEAVADCALVVGTTCHSGPNRIARAPRDVAPDLVARAQHQSVALVFGPEDHGLSNTDLQLCHQLMTIPTAPEYASLNLAQAVMICAYELRLAVQTETILPDLSPVAVSEQTERLYARLRTALLSIGFLHPDNADHIMMTLRRLFGRTGLDEREVRILLGVARQIEWFGQGGWQTQAQKTRAASPSA